MRTLLPVLLLAFTAHAAEAQSLDTARDLLRSGRYDEARLQLETLVEDADLPGARSDLARLHLQLGDVGSANEALAPLFAEGSTPPADARVARAEVLGAEGNYDPALGELDALLDSAAGPELRARLLRAQLRRVRGLNEASRTDFDTLIAAFEDGHFSEAYQVGIAAVAYHHVGAYEAANEAFARALVLDPDSIEIRLDWAELFLEKYRPDQASEIVLEALQRNPHSPRGLALLSRAHAALEHDPTTAIRLAQDALRVNPNLPEAYESLARIALGDEEYPRAIEMLRGVLRDNPNRLPALTLTAAAHYLLDHEREYGEVESTVTAVNPHYPDFYRVVGDTLSHALRHEESIEFYERALRIDPLHTGSLLGLGLGLTRQGHDERGLAFLRRALTNDPFNVRAFHLVHLYEDQLTHYVTFESEHFRFRVHREEREVLENYVPRIVEDVYAWYVERYGLEPELPIAIELFADAETFAIRSVGLPHVAPHGICFGRVITSRSPSEGDFNWAEVLTHEISHVFTLTASRARVPRWFTEGLAEHDAASYRSDWRREGELVLLARLQADALPSVAHLNQAFVRSDNQAEVISAYAQSRMTVAFIEERWGRESLLGMLESFSRHERLDAVIASATGLDLAAFDEAFAGYLEADLGELLASFEPNPTSFEDLSTLQRRVASHPDDADALAALALAQFRARHIDEAQRLCARALAIDDANPLAVFLSATFDVRERRFADARSGLEGLLAGGYDGYTLRTELAYLERQAGHHTRAVEHLERASAIYPHGLTAARDLAELRLRMDDPVAARQALLRVAAIDQNDASITRELLRLDLAMDVPEHAWASCQRALEIAPFDAAVHVDCGRAALASGETDDAIRELELALALGDERRAEIQALLERARQARHGL